MLILPIYQQKKEYHKRIMSLLTGIIVVTGWLLSINPVYAGEYYVDNNHIQASDSNSGTEDSPWLTIQHAADMAGEGDTVYVKEGTYNERVFPEKSGQSGQTITYKALPRRSVTMYGFGLAKLRNYIRIEGFNITTETQTGLNNTNGIEILGGNDNIEVVDNNFYNIPYVGIMCYSSSELSTAVYIADNKFNKVQNGMYINGKNCLIENNDIERLFDFEVFPAADCDYIRFFGENLVFRNNYSHGTLESEIGTGHTDGFQTYDLNGEYAHNVLIENNKVFTAGQGFMEYSDTHHDHRDIIFRYNVFKDTWASGAIVDATRSTFINNNYINTTYWGIIVERTFATYTVIKNNIFYNTRPSPSGNNIISYEFEDTIPTAVADYNLTFGFTVSGPNPGIHDKILVDPVFVDFNNNDFHLQSNSPCIDAGDFLTTTALAGSGTQLPVLEARFFCDGFGIVVCDGAKVVEGDLIQLEGQTQTARVINRDYDNNILHLDQSLTWEKDQGVFLSYVGSAPDIGAHESPFTIETKDNKIISTISSFSITSRTTSVNRIDFLINLKVPGICYLTVYNILGQRIWFYNPVNAQAGSHNVKWTFDSFPEVTNGIYTVLLIQHDKQVSHKFSIIK